MRILPKSLHTVTVLVNVARSLPPLGQYDCPLVRVLHALDILGLADMPDTNALAAQAVAKLRSAQACAEHATASASALARAPE